MKFKLSLINKIKKYRSIVPNLERSSLNIYGRLIV